MPRKLKTYVTSIGFYDLAVAAPSMKAALEAWGTNQNLFHLGLAEETQEPDILAATMDKPGVVLRRAVGTNRAFQKQAALPNALPNHKPAKPTPAKKTAAVKHKAQPDTKAQKAAIISFERARAKRDHARRREEAARAREKAAAEKADAQHQREAAKARAVLDRARERHEVKIEALENQRRVIEDRLAAERERWRKEEKQLERDVHETEA